MRSIGPNRRLKEQLIRHGNRLRRGAIDHGVIRERRRRWAAHDITVVIESRAVTRAEYDPAARRIDLTTRVRAKHRERGVGRGVLPNDKNRRAIRLDGGILFERSVLREIGHADRRRAVRHAWSVQRRAACDEFGKRSGQGQSGQRNAGAFQKFAAAYGRVKRKGILFHSRV